MVAWLICPKCGEIYPEERICSFCLVETVPSCPFCERSAQECMCMRKEITSEMMQSTYIRKALIEGIVKGIYKDNFQNINLVIAYGSFERDIDLLIINNIAKAINRGSLKIGKTLIDFIEISKSLLLSKLEMLDPIYTEPILTGEIYLGDEELLNELKEVIFKTKPNQKLLLYLFNEGIMFLNLAISLISMHIYEGNLAKLHKGDMNLDVSFVDEIFQTLSIEDKKDTRSAAIESAIISLSFSCSYLAFCKHYYENKNVITYRELIKSEANEKLREIEEYKRKILRGEPPNLNRLISLALEVKNLYKNFEKTTLPLIRGLPYWIRKDE